VWLYYGNRTTRAPQYDLAALRGRLALNPRLVAAELGPQVVNPRFEAVPPLRFVAGAGAKLEPRHWEQARRLRLSGGEDIYAVTLAPTDLWYLRPDLGDLRIVDPADRQVPFILERAAVRAELALEFARDPRPAARSERRISRYHVRVGGDLLRGVPGLPLEQLRLSFGDQFFTRPVRVLAPARGGARSRERRIYGGVLTSAADRAAPMVIGLSGAPVRELWLEIDEGDNSPLQLERAAGLLRVPRLTFKVRPEPGAYRLLLGNPRATLPRYDLESLRREVLAYSARPARLLPAAGNPDYRRPLADYFQSGPQTALLWTALLIAVAGLLLLTVRLLKPPPG
jgi:hypothetical protein